MLLAGHGAFDGAEVNEPELALPALDKVGAEVICLAPDRPQAAPYTTGTGLTLLLYNLY